MTAQGGVDVPYVEQTHRSIITPHFGGSAVRLRFSNTFGEVPVTLRNVTLGLSAAGADVVPGSQVALRFGGKTDAVLPPHGSVVSDAVDFVVTPFTKLAVSFYMPLSTGPASVHRGYAAQGHTSYVASGDKATQDSGEGFTIDGSILDGTNEGGFSDWAFLTGLDVLSDRRTASVVAFGDSITDGFGSTQDGDRRYPDALMRRVLTLPRKDQFSILNAGIGGNQVTRSSDVFGPAGVVRFGRDVLGQTGVATAIVMMGLNDIGVADPRGPQPAEVIIAGLRRIADDLHAAGLRVVGGTLTPAGDLSKPSHWGSYSSPLANQTRAAVNAWIRSTSAFDDIVDFDAALRDPANPELLRADYDSGDSLHPNDAGYAAMANAIDIESLAGACPGAARN